ncbi:hypothetical protein Mapa_011256 [Marchantia paleacea]|nr:hypothetical protein Mapa_011256 [Marchantia paleacea]
MYGRCLVDQQLYPVASFQDLINVLNHNLPDLQFSVTNVRAQYEDCMYLESGRPPQQTKYQINKSWTKTIRKKSHG